MSSQKEILSLLAAGTLSPEEANLKLEQINKKKNNSVRYKVSKKGAISIYGLGGRFPITLYIEQLETIVDLFTGSNEWCDEFTTFLAENKDNLTRK